MFVNTNDKLRLNFKFKQKYKDQMRADKTLYNIINKFCSRRWLPDQTTMGLLETISCWRNVITNWIMYLCKN